MPDERQPSESFSPNGRSIPAIGKSTPSGGRSLRVILIYLLIAVIGYFFALEFIRTPPHGGLRPGQTAPPISAAGWLNGKPPARKELAGKIIVVDAWFAACPPCLKKAPEIVKAHQRFSDRGVVFIGLTPDEAGDLDNCRKFLEQTGITWPNGYGAAETLQRFLTDGGYFPSAWVIGHDGRVTWNSDSAGTLEEAIDQALSEMLPPAAKRL